MNKIYKVIWSHVKQCYVVTSELAKAHGRTSIGGGTSRLAVAALTAFVLTAGVTSVGLAADVNGVVKTDDGSLKSVNGVITYDINKNTNGQIALGNKATVFVGKGGQERAISPTGNAGDAAGGIAIGSNTYARTGSIMIGSHSYKGSMGDVQNIDTSKFDTSETGAYGFTVGSTTIGTNSFTKGFLATTIGDYNIQSSRTKGYGSSTYFYGAQNFGATVLGALNSNESASATKSYSYSGIANSIVGTANKVNNSNGTLVFGAGNTVKNSITDITGVSDSTSLRDASKTADTLRNAINKSQSGGATLVIGGGNTAENTLKTQIIGVNNTVTGTEDMPADYNLIDGYKNTATHVKHATVIGSGNTVSGEEKDNVEGLILLGDNRNVWKQADHSVVIGSSDDTGHSYVTRPNTVVIGHNAYIEDHGGNTSGGGDIAIGHNSFVENYVNQSGSIAFGENTHVRNSVGSTENAFVLGQYEMTQDPAGTPIPTDVAKMNASIAIGENTFARTGSLMIGTHKYTGEIGDTTVDTSDATSMAQANQQINETVLGTNSFSLGAFSTVTGAYSIISGDYEKGKWRNFGSSITGSLNSIESKTATTADAGNASHIIGTANRMQNANGAVVIGSGNEITDSYAAMSMPTSNNTSAKDLSEKIRESIKANGGGAAAIVGNGNEVKKSTNVAVMGSKNSVTSTTNSQIFGDNRVVTGADGAPIEGAVIIGSATAESPLKTDKKNVTILGHNANATVEGGVALGAGSVASRNSGTVLNIIGYDPAKGDHSTDTTGTWKATDAAVSVGKADGTMTRQITGVAAGSEDTDAVNVAQLKAVSDIVDASKTKYYSVQKIPFTEAQLGSYAAYTNEANDGAKEVGALAAGYMTYAGGIASTVTGSLSGVIKPAAAPGSRDFRGATALSYGTFNINNNSDKSGAHSGVANSIVGQANMTTDSNAALIYGAGNVISNSYRDIDTSKMGAIAGSLKDPKALGEALQAAVPTSGGQVMAFGGGNVVDNAYMTQVMGVGNTVKGNQKKNNDGTWTSKDNTGFNDDTSSQLNYVDGFYTTLINGKNDYLIGAHNTVTGESVENNHSNIVIGDNHTLENQSNNIILGSADNDLSTTASQVTILGHNANATVDGGAAIGAGSVAAIDKDQIGYDPANGDHQNDTTGTWKSTAAAVSVGDASKHMTRQITGVAAGTQDTDAVNVAQLKQARTKYYSVNEKTPNVFGDAAKEYAQYLNDDNKGAKEFAGLAAGYMTYAGGIASTVTGSFSGIMNEAAQPGSNDFRGAAALSYGMFNLNDNTSASQPFSGVANSIVGQANVTTDSNAAMVYGAGNSVTNSYRAIDVQKAGAIMQGLKDPRQLNEALKAAVPTSGAQVMVMGGGNTVDKAYMTQVVGVGNTVTGSDKEYVEGTSTQLNYVDGFYNKVENGKNDYVIGSHNTLTSSSVDTNKSNLVLGDNHKLTDRTNNVILGSADDELTTSASDAVLIGHNADVKVDGGVALGSGSVASTDKDVEGYDPLKKGASESADKAWKSSWAAVSVGDGTHTRQITGVAAGFADTDAVNVAQLKSVASLPVHIYSGGKGSSGSYTAGNLVATPTISSLQFDFGDGLKADEVDAEGGKRVLVSLDKDALKGDPDFKGDKGEKGDTGAQGEQGPKGDKGDKGDTGAQGEQGLKGDKGDKGDTGAKGDKGDKGDTGAPGKDGKDGKDGGVGTVVGDDTNITVANTETDATKPANYKVSLNKAITVDKVTAGDTTISSNGVSIAGGPSMTKDGIDAGGSKITNVAAGTADTDAVNYGQLKGVESSVQNNTTNINRLSGRVSNLDNRINKVGAGAAALAALHPLDFNPDDKWNFAVGYGNYRNANSVALGAFYQPNENTMFNVATNFGNGENMINAGVSFKIGKGNSYAGVSKAQLVAENQQLKANDVLQDQKIQKQDQEIQELKKALEELKSRIK